METTKLTFAEKMKESEKQNKGWAGAEEILQTMKAEEAAQKGEYEEIGE